MKVLAVLVLAVFTGCNANLFYADAPKTQLEVLTDTFWDYVGKATTTADDTLKMIRESQFGQDVSARLTESTDLANAYATSIQEQLPPQATELLAKVTAEFDTLKEGVIQELNDAKVRMEPYTEKVKAQVQEKIEQLKQELSTMDTEALRTTVMQKSEELRANLEAQLGPYTDDLKVKVDQHLQDFKEKMAPMTERVQTEVTQRVKQVQEMASPFVEEMRGKLDPYAQDLQARLTALYESFTQSS